LSKINPLATTRKHHRLYLPANFSLDGQRYGHWTTNPKKQIMSSDRTKPRGTKRQLKRRLNMSFGELVKRIGQTDTPQQELAEKPKQRKTPKRPKKNPTPG
jgi:hypothetical protein